jgi:hypothetical protein
MVEGVLSQEQIRIALKTHQRRLRAGDDLPTITEIAEYAGCHRDSIYALLNGDQVAYRTQYALSKAVKHFDEVCQQSQKTKLMHVSLGSQGAQLGFGATSRSIFMKLNHTHSRG